MGKIIYEGKSKAIYEGSDKSYIMRFKDAVTAFNGEKKDDLPGKGRLSA